MLDMSGATARNRTADILITSEVLCQLSYGGPMQGQEYSPLLRPCLSVFWLVHACIFSQAAGERADPTQYYFRAVPRFETGAKDYEWLNSDDRYCDRRQAGKGDYHYRV